MADNHLRVVRAGTLAFKVTVTKTIDGVTSAVDLTGATCTMTCREKPSDVAAQFTVAGTILSPATAGRVRFVITPASTSAARAGPYVYDVKIVLADTTVHFPVLSTLELVAQVSA